MQKCSINAQKLRQSVRLVATLFVLLGVLFPNVTGNIHFSLLTGPYATINSPPVVLQAGTAGSSIIYTNGTSAKVSTVAPAPTPTYYPSSYNILSGNWWNLNYGYRKKITVVNNVASSLSSGYSVCLTENTASLISAGKMLPSGNDLRIVYWNATSSSWVELDRDVIDINTGSTKVWFKTQASIAASGSDSNYYMFYGYSGAGSPSTNKNKVYLFYDDFSGGTLDTSKWTIVSGTPTIESGELNLQGNVELKTVAGFDRGYVWEQDVKAQADGANVRVNIVYTDAGNNYHAHLDTNGFRLHTGLDTPLGSSASYVRPSNHLLRFTVTSNTLRVELINKGDSSVTWDSGTVTDTSQTGTKPVGFRYSVSTGTIHFHHDNMKIRSYVSPEPSVSVDTEELSYYVSGTVPASVQNVDSNYLITRSIASGTTTSAYYPTGYTLGGSTTKVSGNVSDLTSNNGFYMTFRSYENTTCKLQYYNSSDGESSTTSGTYTDKLILSFTPSLTGNYLIIASAALRGSSIAYDVRVQMTIDGTTYANPTWQPDEAIMWESFFTSKVINLGSGSHTIRIQYSSENVAQTVTIRRARIMALKLSDYESNEAETEQTVTSGTYADIVTKTFTPSTAGVYLIVATAEVEAASTSNSLYTRLQIDGVAKDEMITLGETTTDYEVFAAHNVTTLSAASHTIKIQAYRQTTGTMYIRRARITAVRLSDCYDYQASGSEGVSSTSSTSWQDKTVLTFTPSTAENYLIMATAKINLNTALNGFQPAINFTIDGTEYGYWQAGLSASTDYLTFAAMINASLSAASHTLKIAYRTTSATYTAYIRDARIVAVKLARQYVSEVEFTGSTNTELWTQLVWTIDSAWTMGSVTVTIQVYNYTLGGYPSSGKGFDNYVSSATANTDETRTKTITTNSTHFRDVLGNWRINVKGVKSTTSQFDLKADLVEFKSTYYSEYTVSTEFLFSSMTKNTPTQLNFTIVSQYNIANVNVTIQVWNYSSSPAYVTSGQGYLTYTSSGSNETKTLSINTNPQSYTSNGNARIKITGVKTTTTQYQQEINQVKLLYSYSSSPTYNYVLKVANNVTDSWKIRLKAYSQSNIGRLNNCTIYFHNASDGFSGQVYIVNGNYTQQTGPSYDLPASPAERYIAVTLQANNSQVSYINVYLEILIPNKTTYAQYVLTFEFT